MPMTNECWFNKWLLLYPLVICSGLRFWVQNAQRNLVGVWTTHPKYMVVKLDHFPRGDNNEKCLKPTPSNTSQGFQPQEWLRSLTDRLNDLEAVWKAPGNKTIHRKKNLQIISNLPISATNVATTWDVGQPRGMASLLITSMSPTPRSMAHMRKSEAPGPKVGYGMGFSLWFWRGGDFWAQRWPYFIGDNLVISWYSHWNYKVSFRHPPLKWFTTPRLYFKQKPVPIQCLFHRDQIAIPNHREKPHRMEHSFQDFQRNIWRDVTPGAAAVQMVPASWCRLCFSHGWDSGQLRVFETLYLAKGTNMFIKFHDFTWNKGYYFFPASATFWGPMVVWGR